MMSSSNGVPNGHGVELLDYDDEEHMEANENVPVIPRRNVDGLPPFAGHATLHSTGFKDFMLKPQLKKALDDAGFEHPSEVQAHCIPQAILGRDIICQAKSGMGKTAVFVISTLQCLDVKDAKQPQIICLSPTRELAYQTAVQFKRFKGDSRIRLALFFGGTPTSQDIEKLRGDDSVHVVIGTPGRLMALVRARALNLKHIKYFIIDECDKMLAKLDMRQQVQEVFQATPVDKQVLMFSATLPRDVLPVCRNFASDPLEIIVDDYSRLNLERLQQFYAPTTETDKKSTLNNLLNILEFNQVIIFANTVIRAGTLGKMLTDENFPAIMIHSAMPQDERLARYQQFKTFDKRILVATDLFGRGMDIERVNVVINYDCPQDMDTYLHRIARAGRFGQKGLAVTFIATEADSHVMNQIQDRFDISIESLPDEIDPAVYRL